MNTNWFKKVGWVYLPYSPFGWLISLLIGLLFIHDLLFIDSKVHSISDLYYQFLPYGGLYAVLYFWIASNASIKNKESIQ